MQFKQSILVVLAGLLSLTVACKDAQGNDGVCKPPNFCCKEDSTQCVFDDSCSS
ncbi:uncharacterized protein LY79DRAFT_675095 [Colletotrichum navitas]|uniref:Uncharacterized protein n=1 Tax=Colletotrichum navitas TaxID=681940 RepID=A0AAD8UWZ2_9PEZI|nr:uncharacterized protein LY79DRAFT_675095 [Colletotrichum navitas]KAK1565893.1 hypothetical protein LY79DRAFT_675095 [Colletotrichum navitas]